MARRARKPLWEMVTEWAPEQLVTPNNKHVPWPVPTWIVKG